MPILFLNPLYSDGFSHTDKRNIRMRLSFIYFKGSQVGIPKYDVFLFLRIVNSVDADEMPHYVAFFIWVLTVCQSSHLGVPVYKGLKDG